MNTSKDKLTQPEELVLIAVKEELRQLSLDEHFMVELTKSNSAIVENLINGDTRYPQTAKNTTKEYIIAGDYSAKSFKEIIRQIATDNSTRSSNKAIDELGDYCADKSNGFLERLNKGDAALVDDLEKHLKDMGFRREKSLCSKVCKYLNQWLFGRDDYAINDSVIRKMLPYYLKKHGIEKTWRGNNLDDISYAEFYSIFKKLKEKVGLSNHELDHLIWYTYKNDNVRQAIAAELAKK